MWVGIFFGSKIVDESGRNWMEESGKFCASRHDVARTGELVLMLPALSSISTRSEMWPLQERLGSCLTTLTIDWVGFGDRPRLPLRWSPDMYRSFLAYLLNEVMPRPFAAIAAGHAATDVDDRLSGSYTHPLRTH